MEIDNKLEYLKNNIDLYISYMKEKYPVYNKSNIFIRDIEHGIKNFFEKKDVKIKYSELEKVTDELIVFMEGKGIIRKLRENTWLFTKEEEIPHNEDEETKQ